MKNTVDYYAVLGVKRDADTTQLKAAYRKLGKMYHPDTNPDNPDAETKMKKINEAYDVLSDPQKRAEYDGIFHAQSGQSAARKGGGTFSGSFGGNMNIDFEDLFNEPFENFFERGTNKTEQRRDKNVKAESAPGSDGDNCKNCNGSGRVRVTVQSGFGKMTQTRECPVCRGKGR